MWVIVKALLSLLKPRPHVTPGDVDFGKANTENKNKDSTKDSPEQP